MLQPRRAQAPKASGAASGTTTNGAKKRPKPRVKPRAAAKTPGERARAGEGRDLQVVGVGASAGGLEALEIFLRNVPDKSGLAFIVVQHLDPTHKDMMVELLQRATRMQVRQVRDRMRVEPDHVYVIPPNKNLSILRGALHLLTPEPVRGLRLPIDFFFRSLAADQQARSIGVILSGMGSDGTLGLRAIKEQAGAVFVQAPDSAKFDGMPRSAIDAGLADVTAPVEKLPDKIVAYLAHAPRVAVAELALPGKTHSAIEKICVVLRSQTGHDFSQYKRSTVYRRIERRMSLHQIDGIAAYVKYLQESPQETQLLFKELLIGVTSFFRDAHAWEQLKTAVIPALLSERPPGAVLRAWVPACSTGEEAYSLAIVFKEVLAQQRPALNYSLQIFATDLDKDAIDRARQGVYPANIAGDVSTERMHRYFEPDLGGYRVSPEIRGMVIFAQQNLIMDPPFTRLDILSCRNLLIYLAPELQKKLLPLFHYSLKHRGILILGSAETVGAATDLFAPADGKLRIYRRLDASTRAEPVEFPATFYGHTRVSAAPAAIEPAAVPNLQTLGEQLLLQRYSPAAVLTNDEGDILYIGGRTGKYLEPAAGKANWNIHVMAREGLRYQLGVAFQKALRERRTIVKNRVELENSATVVDVTVEPLQSGALRGMVMVVFTEVTGRSDGKAAKSKRLRTPVAKIEGELQQARDELLTTREEMQTSQEELRSANEELQSTNEELQSTNEELTTSKEEMQSLNEELQTLNHELQTKVNELSSANDDLRNLLDSTDIATLFLDEGLKVRRFTAKMTKIIKLIQGDIDRPITDLASDLVYPELAADARAVLQTLVIKERPVKTLDGHWFSVRIMPYRTVDNRINGVVITFVDITAAKQLEATLRQGRARDRG